MGSFKTNMLNLRLILSKWNFFWLLCAHKMLNLLNFSQNKLVFPPPLWTFRRIFTHAYRGQNEDYCKYLLTALLHESWRVEDWEVKGVTDMETFVTEEAGEREALQTLLNTGETEVTVARYREEVRKMLGLPETVVNAETVSN